MRPPRPSRRWAVAAIVVLLARQLGAAASAAEPPAVTTAPVLVTTDGPAAGWSTVNELAAAATAGEPRAAFQYARLLETGDQVPRDAQRALEFYQVAAAAGHGDAAFRLGKIHHDGLLGVKVAYPEAFNYYRRAAAAGVPEAMFNLGAMLVSARGVKRDYVEGLAWLLVARESGADADAGIEQVRRRLARRPEWIAAAERRAQLLREELQDPAPPPEEKPEAPAAPPKDRAPVRAPVAIERAGPALTPGVKIDQPSITLPEPPKE